MSGTAAVPLLWFWGFLAKKLGARCVVRLSVEQYVGQRLVDRFYYQPALRTTLRRSKAKRQESSSFLKKRTKKLLLALLRAGVIWRVNQRRKSFLFLFFKKEILSCFANGLARVLPDRVALHACMEATGKSVGLRQAWPKATAKPRAAGFTKAERLPCLDRPKSVDIDTVSFLHRFFKKDMLPFLKLQRRVHPDGQRS
jgi:hypothetical protein